MRILVSAMALRPPHRTKFRLCNIHAYVTLILANASNLWIFKANYVT
jgi:hypothetical protein